MSGSDLPLPRLDWQDGQPISQAHADPYFSRGNGLAESTHVFLQPNGLPERFTGARQFCIGELGFGTGLNFLLSWRAWAERAPAEARLDYLAVEAAPLSRAQLRRALAPWPELRPWLERLCAVLPPRRPGFHCIEPAPRVRLLLLYGDVADVLPRCRARVDAWYLDGFAPARNPTMWAEPTLRQVARLSRPGASLATYSAAGAVRRALQHAGFAVDKRPGFGRKREMLAARCQATRTIASPEPWFDYPAADAVAETVRAGAGAMPFATGCADRSYIRGSGAVGILGDGIAGACLARQLAEDGLPVRLLGGGDGAAWRIPGFLVRPYPEAAASRSSELYAQAFEQARRFYARYAPDAFERQRLQTPQGTLPAAVLRPAAAITALLDHPLIERLPVGHVRVRRDEQAWQLLDAAGSEVLRTQRLLVCTAQPPPGLELALPLQPCSGQVALLDAPIEASVRPHPVRRFAPHPAAQAPQSGEGTQASRAEVHGFTVAGQGQIGSSYRPGEQALDIRESESRELLTRAGLAADRLAGSATGPRWVSADHLPLIGPAPDLARWAADYAALRHGARHRAFPPGACLPGVWLNLAHGSRGASMAPLAALQLAAALQDRPLPLPAELIAAVHPGRFAIRALKRGEAVLS